MKGLFEKIRWYKKIGWSPSCYGNIDYPIPKCVTCNIKDCVHRKAEYNPQTAQSLDKFITTRGFIAMSFFIGFGALGIIETILNLGIPSGFIRWGFAAGFFFFLYCAFILNGDIYKHFRKKGGIRG